MVPPTVQLAATPAYPAAAAADRVTGTVVLRLEIDPVGAVVGVSIVEGVRTDVDEAAVAAARQLRFVPAQQGGAPIPATVDYAFTFALDVADEQGNPVPGTLIVHLTDAEGLPVPGARVRLRPENGAGGPRELASDANGALTAAFLTPGTWAFTVEMPGFTPTSGVVEIGPGETRSTSLTLTAAGPQESVVILGYRQRWREVSRAPREPVTAPITGGYQLTRRDVESTPGALEDVTRAVHKLPGVASDGDFVGTFSVRGATSGEVVFLLDRVPLDNPFHLAGFNSIFNPDMLERVDFFASAAPSSYPDTTSAVMDVSSWDGTQKDDRRDLNGAIDLSMSTARLLVMGPIGRPTATPANEPTFAFAVRRSYLEAYFGAMKVVNVLDTAVAAPEYGELSGRVAWRRVW